MSQSNKEHDPVVAARIPIELRQKLLIKHPNKGDISKVIKVLLERYLQGKILGVVINKST